MQDMDLCHIRYETVLDRRIQDGDWAEKRRLHNGLYQLDLMQQRSITQLITVVKDGTV